MEAGRGASGGETGAGRRAKPALVSRPEQLDPAWLSEVLRAAGVLPQGRVVRASWRVIGTGKMADNVRYELCYEDAPPEAPASVVAKLPAADALSRRSGAGGGSYRREVRFYQQIAPRTGMRTPRCFYADVDDAGADFAILMEDMAPAAAGDQIAGCGADVAALAIAEAVKLHAPFWGDASLGQLDWLTPSSPEAATFAQALLQHFWPGFLERFGHGLDTDATALGRRFVDGYLRWSAGYQGQKTLIHADYRLENMLLAPAGAAGAAPIAVVDWQTTAQGCGLADVAYFLGGGLSVDERRAHERALVGDYCARLRAAGVPLADDVGWREYRRFSLHGVLITVLGAMVTGQDPRGDRMFLAMAQRHLQHALDLCDEALPA